MFVYIGNYLQKHVDLTCCLFALGLGIILIYHQYRNTAICNNQHRRHFHMSIISCMQYITEYHNISQCSTIGLSTQSTVNMYQQSLLIDKVFSAAIITFTYNTHVDDAQLCLSTPCWQ